MPFLDTLVPPQAGHLTGVMCVESSSFVLGGCSVFGWFRELGDDHIEDIENYFFIEVEEMISGKAKINEPIYELIPIPNKP